MPIKSDGPIGHCGKSSQTTASQNKKYPVTVVDKETGKEKVVAYRADIPKRKFNLSVEQGTHPTDKSLYKVKIQNEYNTQHRWMTDEQVARLFDVSFEEAMQWGEPVKYKPGSGRGRVSEM